MPATKLRLVGRRLVQAAPSVLGIIVVTFVLTRALPGDPAVYFAGVAADAESIAQVRKALGLDKSLPQQFAIYVVNLFRGDLGQSLSTGSSVLEALTRRLPASLELTLCGLLFAVMVAVPLGIVAATHPGSWVDHLCRILVTAGVSLPTFFTGLFLVYIFYYLPGWMPSPLGLLDFLYLPPPTVTGFYLIDSLLASDKVRPGGTGSALIISVAISLVGFWSRHASTLASLSLQSRCLSVSEAALGVWPDSTVAGSTSWSDA